MFLGFLIYLSSFFMNTCRYISLKNLQASIICLEKKQNRKGQYAAGSTNNAATKLAESEYPPANNQWKRTRTAKYPKFNKKL
jgi:hypothetical protein